MICAFGLTLASCAQNELPSEVKSSFDKKFPNATSIKWDKENDSEWEAEFKNEGISYSANFSSDGTWVETEHSAKQKDLPMEITSLLKSDFSEYKIEEIEKFEKPNSSGYDIEIEKGEEMFELVFDNSGKLLEKKTIKEEDE